MDTAASFLRSHRRGLTLAVLVAALSLALLALAGCGSDASNDSQALYESKCSTCHSLDVIDQAGYSTSEEWGSVVNRMKDMTSTISDDDANKITEYLANR